MSLIARAEDVISTAVYRLGRADPKVGELRTRTWRCLIAPAGEADPHWAQRCANYWHTQERLYGLRMSDFLMTYDAELGVITTASTVLAVLPGKRVRGHTPGWLIEGKMRANG